MAALVACFFALLYSVVALNLGGEWQPAMFALAACYLTAFIAVVAPWFWGRWFAAGLGWSGAVVGAVGLFMMGWSWPLAIYAGLHGLLVAALAGRSMGQDYEQQTAWRARFKMDELGVARLGKTVTRSAASLPSLVLWALGPKEPGQALVLVIVGLASVLGAGLGLRAVLRLRTWGVLAVAAASVVAAGLGQWQAHHAACWLAWPTNGAAVATLPLLSVASSAVRQGALLIALGLAASVIAPLWSGVVRHLRERS